MDKKGYSTAYYAYQSQVENMRCTKCKIGHVQVLYDDENYTFKTVCTRCSKGKWDRVENFVPEYNRNKDVIKRISVKLIKSQNDKFGTILKNNLAKLKMTDVITKAECDDALVKNPTSMLSVYNNLKKIMDILRMCSRVELLVLNEVYSLPVITENHKINSKDTITLSHHTNNNPVVTEIENRMQINNVRDVLKRLMNKGLIRVNEEDNFIDMHPILIQNKDELDKLIDVNSTFDNEIVYKVLKKHNYRCSNCLETGIPIKIAYLKRNKNKDDINAMIPLCSVCYDDLTQNEVVIDGTLVFFNGGNNIKAWEFINYHIPEMSKTYYKTAYMLTYTYGEENLIKAMAITIDAYKRGKFINAKAFYKYIRTILDRAIKNGTEIYIPKDVETRCNVKEWITL